MSFPLYTTTKSDEWYQRASQVIPSGVYGHLGPAEGQFIPVNRWPRFSEKAKGSYFWDVDGNKYLDMMCTVKGDRYEYETNMLLMMKRNNIPFAETKIQTVYINENETSHFRPVRDSLRIYSLIFKHLLTSPFILFLGSAGICYVIDWLLFKGFNFALGTVTKGLIVTVAAYGGARILSSMLNFYLNRLIFKKQGGSILATMIKYYLLVAFNILLGSVAVYLISTGLLSINSISEACMNVNAESPASVIEPIVKLPVDVLLYLFNYTVQKHIVFKKDNNNDAK